MLEAELAGVEHLARGLDARNGRMTAVNALSDEGETGLGQVDTDLVGATGLEPTIDQGSALEHLDRGHVGDRDEALVGVTGGAAQPIATVGDEARAEGARGRHRAVDDGRVAAVGGVLAELLAEVPLGLVVDEPLVAADQQVAMVRIGPGQMQLTVMPSRPSSTASARVKPVTPAFAAA